MSPPLARHRPVFGHSTKTGREMAFNLDLKAGDTVRLRIANNKRKRLSCHFCR